MAFPWDPRLLLDTYPDSRGFTCVGKTQRGSRCKQSMISGADLLKASQILDNMSLSHPSSRHVDAKLADLAYLTLCPRWHRKPGYCQVTEIVQKWQRTIENYCDLITATRPVTTSRRRPEVATRSVPSIPTSSSEYVRERRAPLPSSETVIEDPLVPSAPSRPTVLHPRAAASSTPPASPQSSAASPVAARTRDPTTSSRSELPTPPTTPTRQNNASAAAASPTNIESPCPSRQNSTNTIISTAPCTPTPSVPVQTPCSRPHRVVRKPITEDCGVCYEPICCPDDAVWCRAQCGQNIHRGCFKEWRGQSLRQAEERRMDYGEEGEEEEDNSEVVNCVFCRARWRWEWED
jgi:hypothetical protein